MVEEKNIIKIQEIFLGLSIIALPFDSIPNIFSISIIGTKLSLYFTIIALLSCITRNVFWPKKTINTIFIYMYLFVLANYLFVSWCNKLRIYKFFERISF